MAKVTPISEHFQHFLGEMKETFWGDLYGETKLAWRRFFELQSERERDRFSGCQPYERSQGRQRGYRNGYYERGFVTRLGTIRLRIARTREKSVRAARLDCFQERCNYVPPRTHEVIGLAVLSRQVARQEATLTCKIR